MPSDDQQLLTKLGLEPGSNVAGKYRIESLIASGGMGAVLRAHHEVLDQTVAIKVMRPELASEREAAQRFLREARAAAKIASDYVCRVTDVDLLEDSTPYMVMEYLEGSDLDVVIEDPGEVVVSDAVDYVMQALAGLEAAHAIGIVHRDLKPSNLFLVQRPDGTRRVKVLDFGISKVMDGESGGLKAGATTSTQAVLGTPRYMSPEQISSAKDVDARTDLWAVGLILYELLAKHYPFEGDNAGALLAAVLTSEPPPLRSIRRDVPPELHAAVHRCLSKNREHRFKGARSLLKALGPFASRRVQALLLSAEELAPAIAPTESLGTPSAAIDALRDSIKAAVDADEVPTLEASVAAAMGELDMSPEDLDRLAEQAAAKERAAATPHTSISGPGSEVSPFEATANLPESDVSGQIAAADMSGQIAAADMSQSRLAADTTTDTAVSIPMQGVGSNSNRGMLIGVAALIAVGIFGGGVWFISQNNQQANAESAASAGSSDTADSPIGSDVSPAGPETTNSGEAAAGGAAPSPTPSTTGDASADVGAEDPPKTEPVPAEPNGAQPKTPLPKTKPVQPKTGPKPVGPKPTQPKTDQPKPKPNIDDLLNERD